MHKMNGMSACRCPHHAAVGAFVFLFGLMFLLHTTGMLSDMFVNYGWPILVMAVGLHKLVEGVCSCCKGKMKTEGANTCETQGGCGGNCGCGDNHADQPDHK